MRVMVNMTDDVELYSPTHPLGSVAVQCVYNATKLGID